MSRRELTARDFFHEPPGMRVCGTMTRNSLWSAALAAALFCLPETRAQDRPVFARAPYLQMATTNSIYVVWRTEGPITPVVRYGKSPDRLTSELSYVSPDSGTGIVVRVSLGDKKKPVPSRWQQFRTEENLQLRQLHSAPVGTFQYEARLMGLEPNTRYYYGVFDGDKRLTPADPSYTFVTAPPAGKPRPVRFWAIGDGGTGRPMQHEVYQALWEITEQEKHPIDFWLHLGDMAYGVGRDMEFQTRFFESYELALRKFVCWPTMGNHEGYTSKGSTQIGPYYDAYVVPRRAEAVGLASGTEAYYSFDWANIHFVCLNSHDADRKPGGPMAKWLKADLEKTKADWIIAFWHHPPYTKGSHDSEKEKDLVEVRVHLMPIIESGGVDMVLTGHSHIYERSMLMDGAYNDKTISSDNTILDDGDGDPDGDGAYRKIEGIHPHQGTVQIVAGHAGQTLGRKGTLPIMKRTIMEYGSVLVDVNGDVLTARMLNQHGRIRDVVSMVKRGKVEPTRVTLPWQPEEWKKPTNEVKHATAQPPVDYKVLIPHGAEWEYLAGAHPTRDWTRTGFDTAQWKRGTAGFGFGNIEARTPLERNRGGVSSIYLRKEFTIEQADKVTELGLLVDYQDGFIAYLNGREVARQNIGRSSGRNVQKVKAREHGGRAYVALKDAHRHLKDGANLLAIEVHTVPDGMDLHIDPLLLLED
jgi:acid phosphatase type 7